MFSWQPLFSFCPGINKTFWCYHQLQIEVFVTWSRHGPPYQKWSFCFSSFKIMAYTNRQTDRYIHYQSITLPAYAGGKSKEFQFKLLISGFIANVKRLIIWIKRIVHSTIADLICFDVLFRFSQAFDGFLLGLCSSLAFSNPLFR